MRQTRLFLISLLVVTVSLPVQAGAEMGKAAVEKATGRIADIIKDVVVGD